MRIDRAMTVVAPSLVAAAMTGATQLRRFEAGQRQPAILLFGAAALAIAALAGAFFSRRRGRWQVAADVASAAWFVATAYGFLLLVEGVWAKYAVIGSTAALLAAHYACRRRLTSGNAADAEAAAYLAFAMRVISCFFLFAFGFGAPAFVQLPVAVPALAAAFAAGASAYASVKMPTRRSRLWVSGAFAVFAAELFVALSFLPTAAAVNAAVAVLLFALALRVAAQAMHGPIFGIALRRHFAMTFALVALVLGTAQWV